MTDEYRERQIAAATPDYSLLPVHLRGGMEEFIQRGHIPGDFLQACLSNDLTEAVSRADETSQRALVDIVKWLYNDAPSGAWGSVVKMRKWSQDGGLEGGAL